MLVDVVRMRAVGKKLPAEQVKAETPVRGRLIIKTTPWREDYQPTAERVPTTFVYLLEPTADNRITPPLVPFLREAHLNSLDGDSFVVVGLEKTSADHGTAAMPQAWWCRVVRGP